MNRMKPAVLAIAILGLAACSSSKEQPQLDYQTQNRKIVNLEVPPDLTNPNQGNLYQVPAGSGSVRASDLQRRNNQQPAANSAILQDIRGVHLQREGNQRWLVVSGKQPAELWPLLKAFWQENGFTISAEEPAIGQMETEWAENRAKIPQDGLRNLFEKVGLGGIYSTSERDKFTARMERGQNGDVNIFFIHKGMKEIYADKNKDTTMWEPRPNDPNLEAAFLGRFMQYLGADEQQVQQELKQNTATNAADSQLARLEGKSLLLAGDYNRNWQRTGMALQRIGLNVLGQNAEKHAYLVQAVPNEANDREKKPGFFSRMLGKKNTETSSATLQPELIVFVEPTNNGARIQLLNKDGSPYQGKDAPSLLERLYAELR